MLYSLITEQQNSDSLNIDTMNTIDILKIMNEEDKKVAYAVERELGEIASAIDAIVERMQRGGRLLYFGAGTSGRLGILDAAECPPTFGTRPELVQGIMAGGGAGAFNIAREDIEDHKEEGAADVVKNNITQLDSIIGISASGQAPYVLGALEEAKKRGALTISIACNEQALLDDAADININVVVGPEIIMGSTRLKAGTAQKMVLNMISTATMIKMGKVYRNLMVDVKPKNKKLIERAKRIIMLATGVSYEEADRYFKLSNKNAKVAIVMIEAGVCYETACELLEQGDGFVSQAIEIYQTSMSNTKI
ncbi:N-acetylmuramic acid 6-phosphate etherase [Xylanivirga thermophila]|uniref:N-acetylmuramic acid 6-phosphate etherase n=1 Tax=Xylanivirga thermophila TaxID=2496273 RepID=UPI0039F5421B